MRMQFSPTLPPLKPASFVLTEALGRKPLLPLFLHVCHGVKDLVVAVPAGGLCQGKVEDQRRDGLGCQHLPLEHVAVDVAAAPPGSGGSEARLRPDQGGSG